MTPARYYAAAHRRWAWAWAADQHAERAWPDGQPQPDASFRYYRLAAKHWHKRDRLMMAASHPWCIPCTCGDQS